MKQLNDEYRLVIGNKISFKTYSLEEADKLIKHIESLFLGLQVHKIKINKWREVSSVIVNEYNKK